jgi:hypothetical protein
MHILTGCDSLHSKLIQTPARRLPEIFNLMLQNLLFLATLGVSDVAFEHYSRP